MPPDGEPPRGRFFASARARILASYLILLLFSTAVGTIVLREVLLARAGERVDDALVQEIEEFRKLADIGRNPETAEPFGDDVRAIFDVFLVRNIPAEAEAFYTYANGEFYDASYAPTVEERQLPQIRALADTTIPRRGEFETEDQKRFRYVAVPVDDRSGDPVGVFAVAIDLSTELDEVNEALQIAVGVNIGVLILASMLAWVIAGRVLLPLRLLRDTARSISESDLTRRIPVEGETDELADLARTFNEMLDRLEEAFASQKSFISDAGHELRTPITIIRGHLDVMGDDPEERRETLDLVRDELDRMSRLVNDLLLLAKASRPDFLQPETVDLDDLTRELYAKASALAQRDWRLSSVGTGRIVADRQRVTQALMNLSQNAVTHTMSGDAVELGSKLQNGLVRFWVKDTGPGVPEHEQQRIFERFVRLDRAPAGEGAGLGLAITQAVAEAHGGRVELDSRPGEGARFTVIIPTEPPQEVTPR
ncbi:MAG TPA: ATP-binding protein [Thermoleophilaceae bacterium]|nr:ATP-binding protein [Thermoleophilaceae bacterium]